MTTDQIVDSRITTMTDLGGKKSKALILKNETEIEAFKEQLRIGSVSQQRELLIDLVKEIKLASRAVPMTEDRKNELVERIKSINCLQR